MRKYVIIAIFFLCQLFGLQKVFAQRIDYSYWETYGQYVPAVAAVGLGLVGVEANDKLWLRFTNMGIAYLAEYGVVNGILKNVISEERPDKRGNSSFPSGHTTTAFLGAEFVRYEYGNWWGVGAYTLASAVGVSRVCHKRHYIWDVGAGAVLGFSLARFGIFTMRLMEKKIDSKNNVNVSFSPVYYDKKFQMNLSISGF